MEVSLTRRALAAFRRSGWSSCWGLPLALKVRRCGSVVFRRASCPHRLVLRGEQPVWSLFITGPWQRHWGFHFEHGWRHHADAVDAENPGLLRGATDDLD